VALFALCAAVGVSWVLWEIPQNLPIAQSPRLADKSPMAFRPVDTLPRPARLPWIRETMRPLEVISAIGTPPERKGRPGQFVVEASLPWRHDIEVRRFVGIVQAACLPWQQSLANPLRAAVNLAAAPWSRALAQPADLPVEQTLAMKAVLPWKRGLGDRAESMIAQASIPRWLHCLSEPQLILVAPAAAPWQRSTTQPVSCELKTAAQPWTRTPVDPIPVAIPAATLPSTRPFAAEANVSIQNSVPERPS